MTNDIPQVPLWYFFQSQRKKIFSDHTSYSFDKNAIKLARHTKDLIISIPQLHLDPINNTISSIQGGKLLILINGIESTNLQLQSIKPYDCIWSFLFFF